MERSRGQSNYFIVDVQNSKAVEEAVRAVIDKYGRLDLVIHGAGVQDSRQIERKPIEVFRRVVGTKLGGLVSLRAAVSKVIPNSCVHFHLLTSAFSFFGNDGQEDYGAANEAMNRLAETLHRKIDEGSWSTLAWLGWIGVGMTRASEYIALAKTRGLRAVYPSEGKELFIELLEGPHRTPVNVLVTQGELAWYKVPVNRPKISVVKAAPGEVHQTAVKLSLNTAPYLRDHLVRGIPTVPGTFEIELASQACAARSPGWKVVGLTRAQFQRFLKVRLLSDFIHSSGRVLEKGIEHFTSCIRLQRSPTALPKHVADFRGSGLVIADPYLLGETLKLNGLFRCLHNIELHQGARRAIFRIQDDSKLETIDHFITPAVLLDALCRLSMMSVGDNDEVTIYVPIQCGESRFAAGFNDSRLHALESELLLTTAAPRLDADGQFIRCEWTQAQGSSGRIVASVKDLVAMPVEVMAQAS
jgi:NAD(P)-dependent dehydrogenase (short-subunit alcohol dehydrogenase family)